MSEQNGRVTRGQRRREQTRRQLLDAGRAVFADKGVDAATIQDITEAADVARGSFYNFFETKEELAAAVALEINEQLAGVAAVIDGITDDPAEALALALRAGAIVVNENPVLAWFAVRHRSIGGHFDTVFHDLIVGMIVRGVEAGSFDVPDAELAYIWLAGMVMGRLEAALLGRTDDDGTVTTEYVLRLLGVDAHRARALCSAALPDAFSGLQGAVGE